MNDLAGDLEAVRISAKSAWQSTPNESHIDFPDRRASMVSRASMCDTLALVLAGGKGTRLGSLTAHRAKPAVPIGGKYRIIDFALSNCLNSHVPHVGVLTQYMAESLVPYVESWCATAYRDGLSVRPLQASEARPYLGTADAVYKNRDVIRSLAPAYVLVLAADHVYRMDYAAMLEDHRRHGAQVTVGCVEVPIAEAGGFGIMDVDRQDRVTVFAEKPLAPRSIPGRSDVALASMGIYIFDTAFLMRALNEDGRDTASTHDFGKDVIPRAVADARVHAHRLRDTARPERAAYWRDVGTLDTYWRTSFEIADQDGGPDFEDRSWSIRSAPAPGRRAQRDVARTRTASTAVLTQNVVFPGAQIARGALVEDSIILPGARIGNGCVVRKAIIEEGWSVPAGTAIGIDRNQDLARFDVSPHGVVLVGPRVLDTV